MSDFPAGDFTVGHDVVAGNLACGVIYLNIADQLPGGGPAFIPIPGASPCD